MLVQANVQGRSFLIVRFLQVFVTKDYLCALYKLHSTRDLLPRSSLNYMGQSLYARMVWTE